MCLQWYEDYLYLDNRLLFDFKWTMYWNQIYLNQVFLKIVFFYAQWMNLQVRIVNQKMRISVAHPAQNRSTKINVYAIFACSFCSRDVIRNSDFRVCM